MAKKPRTTETAKRDRRRSALRRRASDRELARLRQAVEASGEVIFMTDQEGIFTYVNSAFSRLYGYAPSEVVGLVTPRILKSGLATAEAYAAFWRHLLAKQVVAGVIKNRTKDGTLLEVDSSSNPILDDSGAIVGFLAVQRDITERTRAAEALRASESRYRVLAESAHDVIFIIDPNLQVQYLNQFGGQVLASTPSAIVGKRLTDVFPAPVADKYERGLRHVLTTGESTYTESASAFVNREAWLGTRLVPLRNDAGTVTGVLGIARDITDRWRAEQALRSREAELNEAQRVAGVGSWEWIVATERVTWSEELRRMLGLDPCLPPPTYAGLPSYYATESWERLRPAVEKALREGGAYELELQMLRADGAGIWTTTRGEAVRDSSGCTIGLRGTVLDITARRRAEEALRASEERLRQALKMQAVGQLAGGVAHDFNNLLTVVLGNANLLLEAPETSPATQKLVRDVIESAERGANLTRQLLAFGRRQFIKVRPLSLNALLVDLLKMLGRLLGEHITVRCSYAADLPPVEADAGMIEQIIMNLAVNARDAMPGGGSLSISTRLADIDSAVVARNPEARVGRFVALTVSDSGAGMDTGTLAHIFEPFFTTKDVGEGTGLGLATVHGIVQQHNGWIEVASHVGHGSIFTVFLPAGAPESLLEEPSKADSELRGGHEAILIVEDEAAVRTLAVECLRQRGYDVVEAGNGPDALHQWEEGRKRIDLLVTDMVMPEGMSGRELAARLRRNDPSLRVVYTSGYSADTDLLTDEAFLPKPYTPSSLAQAVRRCLDAR